MLREMIHERRIKKAEQKYSVERVLSLLEEAEKDGVHHIYIPIREDYSIWSEPVAELHGKICTKGYKVSVEDVGSGKAVRVGLCKEYLNARWW